MSAMTTCMPSAAKRVAIALPIPDAPPVTTATLPLSSCTARNVPAGASCDAGGMLDHVGIQCADLARQRGVLRHRARAARRGADDGLRRRDRLRHPAHPDFWIGAFDSGEGFRESHIAFSRTDRATVVRAFFDAAVGRRRRGPPRAPRVARVPRALLRRVRPRPRRQQRRSRLPRRPSRLATHGAGDLGGQRPSRHLGGQRDNSCHAAHPDRCRGRRYRPFHCGGRFSAKARGPST